MEELQMVDLKGQYNKIKTEVDKAINNVLDTTAFIKGPEVKNFENDLAKYLNCKKVIACANGTDALQLAIMALDLPQGSEVITPDFTFVATAEVVRLLGFTPVLVDVGPDTFTIDIEKLKAAITDKTRVIIPVHLFGQCADMNAIMKIASEHNIFVIEDTAQAIGTDYTLSSGEVKKAGTIGHIGCTSFFPSKNLGCFGDGGAIFTNDEVLGQKISLVANHGMSGQYDYKAIGINSRLDTLQAAVLGVKLQHLDEYNKARQNAASFYDKAFEANPNIQTPKRAPNTTHTFHQYTMRIKNGKRDELMQYLNDHKIPNKVYYPSPIHEYGAYTNACVYKKETLENTIQLCKDVLSLPMHTELSNEQLEYITGTVNKFFN